jgi:hypothetical protein
MTEQIKDGSGNGYLAKVDSENRLFVRAITQSEAVHENTEGLAFNINTGDIELTNATETPVIYLKNNEDLNLIIEAVAIGLAPSTNGDSGETVTATFIKNPTAGTIVDTESAVAMNSNRNYGSSRTLDANVYKGATGNTMTDGTDHIYVYLGTGAGRSFITINEVIPKGKSLGIKIKPQTSNSSQKIYVAVICYLEAAA